MEKLEKKTFKVSRGYTYTYYTSPAKDGKPTLSLTHGFPDEAELWSGFINNYLVPNGYGAIAYDCLGYAGTSKPLDPKAYAFSEMTKDLSEILDSENISKVVPVGHDWGSTFAQRFYNFYPERCIGLVTVNVALSPPDAKQPFDLDAVNQLTQQIYGYGTFWYWKFFTAPDGPEIMNNHVESMFAMAHCAPEAWRGTLVKPDGARNYVAGNRIDPVEPYATDEMRARFIERLSNDKFDAPICWYKAMTEQVQHESDKKIPPENIVVNVPCLFWGGSRDLVCRPENLQPSIDGGLLPHLKSQTVDAGHWALLAKPEEFGKAMVGWLQENFA